MGLIGRAVALYRERRLSTLLRKLLPYAYQQLWPYLPEDRYILKNGIVSSERTRITDRFLPGYITKYTPSDIHDYEAQYVKCIRDYVEAGEKVVLVGGGEGISTVVAAKQVQSGGTVDVFEGGAKEIEKTRETSKINGVDELITVHHAIVSNDYSLRSSADGADIVPPTELPECDTLAIDADGAEIPILEEITPGPETLIVEHHMVLDKDEIVVEYQPERVRSLIQDLGYDVVEEVSDPTRAYGRFEETIFVGKRA